MLSPLARYQQRYEIVLRRILFFPNAVWASASGCFRIVSDTLVIKRFNFTLVKEALIEIGCVVHDVVGRWSLVVTRVHCGQTVHPRPIVTMEH